MLVHLPDRAVCSVCQDESNDIVFCFDCGKVWMAEFRHGGKLEGDSHKGINLGELRRVTGEGDLHVIPLMFKG